MPLRPPAYLAGTRLRAFDPAGYVRTRLSANAQLSWHAEGNPRTGCAQAGASCVY